MDAQARDPTQGHSKPLNKQALIHDIIVEGMCESLRPKNIPLDEAAISKRVLYGGWTDFKTLEEQAKEEKERVESNWPAQEAVNERVNEPVSQGRGIEGGNQGQNMNMMISNTLQKLKSFTGAVAKNARPASSPSSSSNSFRGAPFRGFQGFQPVPKLVL